MNPIIFLIIIAVVLGVYGLIFYTKIKQSKRIVELDEQKNAIFQIPNDVLVLKLNNMHLSGKTKNLYESYANQWEVLVNEQLPTIEEKLEQAEQFSNALKLRKASLCISESHDIITDSEKKALQINEALQVIVESESSTHEEIEASNAYYQKIRNDLLTNSVRYKESFATIEDRLTEIESELVQFNQLMEEADYIEAKEVLQAINQRVQHLEKHTSDVPSLMETFDVTYAEQLSDLKTGHERMLSEQFKFADTDIEKELAQLSEMIAEGKQAVIQLETTRVKEQQAAIELEIERLYDVMEQEVTAKASVNKVLPRIEAKLTQIVESNKHVLVELDRIQQSYELSDDEEVQLQEFAEKLSQQEQLFNDLKIGTQQNRFVYSQTKERLTQMVELLTQIDKDQANIMKSLSELKQRERFARDQVESFEFDLRQMKRDLERQHLPGLPKNYLELFFATTKRIEELSEQLNRLKINMKEIDELVTICTQDVEKLDETTEIIIDNALLTEHLIQYANRYRMEYAAIDKAITVAMNLYQHQFKYDEAKQTIAQALDAVESGASKRVEQLYQQDKNQLI